MFAPSINFAVSRRKFVVGWKLISFAMSGAPEHSFELELNLQGA